MPAPISSNSSVYDPSQQLSRAEDCDASTPSSATSGSTASAPLPLRTITLDPTYVVEDLGARALVEQHERSQAPSCAREQKDAIVSCAAAGAAALGAAATAVTVVVAAAQLPAVFMAGVNCGRDLRTLRDCEPAP